MLSIDTKYMPAQSYRFSLW